MVCGRAWLPSFENVALQKAAAAWAAQASAQVHSSCVFRRPLSKLGETAPRNWRDVASPQTRGRMAISQHHTRKETLIAKSYWCQGSRQSMETLKKIILLLNQFKNWITKNISYESYVCHKVDTAALLLIDYKDFPWCSKSLPDALQMAL